MRSAKMVGPLTLNPQNNKPHAQSEEVCRELTNAEGTWGGRGEGGGGGL